MAGRRSWIRSVRKHLTLTQLSVITGILASLVTVAAVFGIVGGGDEPKPTGSVEALRAGKPVAGVVYSGETEQGEPIHFSVYVDGRSIRDLTVPLEGVCSDGGPFTTTYRQGTATTFVITGGILSGSSSVRGVTGAIVDGIFRIYARFDSTGRTAMGRVSEHAEVKNGGTCDTPQIMFTVTAKRA